MRCDGSSSTCTAGIRGDEARRWKRLQEQTYLLPVTGRPRALSTLCCGCGGTLSTLLYRLQIFRPPSRQIRKQAGFCLWLYNFNLVWRSACAYKEAAVGVGRWVPECSLRDGVLCLIGAKWCRHKAAGARRFDVRTRTAREEPQKDEREDKTERR